MRCSIHAGQWGTPYEYQGKYPSPGGGPARATTPSRRRPGRQTRMITHDLNLAPDADRILVVDRGHLVETGRHEALLTHGGTYAHLHGSQPPPSCNPLGTLTRGRRPDSLGLHVREASYLAKLTSATTATLPGPSRRNRDLDCRRCPDRPCGGDNLCGVSGGQGRAEASTRSGGPALHRSTPLAHRGARRLVPGSRSRALARGV